MAMTKSTTIVWGSKTAWQNPQSLEATLAKLQEMQAAGKTDMSYDIEDPETELIWTRFWLDQAAAEEFIAFRRAEAESEGLGSAIISTSIGDYTPPV